MQTKLLRNALSVALAIVLGAAAPLVLAQQAVPTPVGPSTDAQAGTQPSQDAADAADLDEADAVEAAQPMADDAQALPKLPRGDVANPAPADPSLRPVFEQFGGRDGLVALMDDFMTRLLADARTRPYFENADQARIKQHLVEQFCVILGGPCQYTGKDMKTSHEGLGIDRGAFNALVEDLQLAMNARQVPFRAQNRLLAKLAPMHREIEDR